jgi:hypothetical protein
MLVGDGSTDRSRYGDALGDEPRQLIAMSPTHLGFMDALVGMTLWAHLGHG